MRAVRSLLFISLLLASGALAAEQDWTFLPIEDIGAREFLEAHPDFDGRGVIVAVFDTGVDMTIPGLGLTSQGLTKVIDLRDFTGQGDIELEEAEFTDEGFLDVAALFVLQRAETS